MTKTKYILIAITLVAFALRVYQANTYPPMLWDEASLGYNAYSIIKTGRDEYGQFLPLIFKSFGDYKPGLYIYSAVPFIAALGLNPQATRLPSIIAGSFLPLFLYLLIVTTNPKQKNVALLAAAILAFNPYNIHFSKGAWESNLMLFEIVSATWLFFLSLKRPKPKLFPLLLSAFIFSTTFYTYQSAKLITPFIVVSLLLVNRQQLTANLKSITRFFAIPLLILALPLIYGLIFNHDSNRLQVISLLSYPRPSREIGQMIQESSQLDYQIFHNQLIFFSQNFLTRYFNQFSPRFLIFSGDWQNPRHSAPYIGVILYPSLIFLILGLFTTDYRKKAHLFFLLWLLLAPIPASLTRDTIQAVRSLPLSIPLVFFIAQGIYIFCLKFRHPLIYFFILASYGLSFIYYSDLYYNHMVKKSPTDFLFGYQQVVDYLNNHPNHEHVYFTDFYGQPYIFYLFFTQYDPILYQSQAKLVTKSLDTGTVAQIENITFSSVYFTSLSQKPHSLLIMSQDEIYRQDLTKNPQFVSQAIPLGQINNQTTFYLYETK